MPIAADLAAPGKPALVRWFWLLLPAYKPWLSATLRQPWRGVGGGAASIWHPDSTPAELIARHPATCLGQAHVPVQACSASS